MVPLTVMPIELQRLRAIAADVTLVLAGRGPVPQTGFGEMVDYHGFAKAPVPRTLMATLPSAGGLRPEDIQADLVRVSTDLRHEVHYHARASAVVVYLGTRHGFPNPVRASAFLGDSWTPVVEGSVAEIPPGVLHGFTVEDGGLLYFLSVQSPPIASGGGDDDYHLPAGFHRVD